MIPFPLTRLTPLARFLRAREHIFLFFLLISSTPGRGAVIIYGHARAAITKSSFISVSVARRTQEVGRLSLIECHLRHICFRSYYEHLLHHLLGESEVTQSWRLVCVGGDEKHPISGLSNFSHASSPSPISH